MPSPGKNKVEVVDSTGKTNIVHIADFKHVLPAERIISELPLIIKL